MKKQHFLIVLGLLFASRIMDAQKPQAVLRLDSVWGCPGEIVEMPLRIVSGVKDSGISSFMMYLDIDTALVEPITVNWNPAKAMGQPVISDLHPKIQSGSFIANYFWASGWQFTKPTMALTFMASGLNFVYGLEDTILGKIKLRIKNTASAPVVIRPSTLAGTGIFYGREGGGTLYQTVFEEGHIVPKSAPQVTILGKTLDKFHNSSNIGTFYPDENWDFLMCRDQQLQLEAAGAQRYEWSLFAAPSGHFIGYTEDPNADQEALLEQEADEHFNRRDVQNPIFTSPEDYVIKNAKVMLKGYNEDGCYSTDTALIHWHFIAHRDGAFKLKEQPPYHYVKKDSAIDLKLVFETEGLSYYSNPYEDGYRRYGPYTYEWYPKDKVLNPNDSVTKTVPLTEPTWFFGRYTDVYGCELTVDIKVDIHNDSLFGTIGKSVETPFCGMPQGEEMHTVRLAALVKGGSSQKSYQWEYQKLYDTLEDLRFSDPLENTITLSFRGTTAVSVRVTDLLTFREIVLTDTIFVNPVLPSQITIDLDAKSRKQYEMNNNGYCIGTPITFEAKTQNLGENPRIVWEVNGYRTNLEGPIVTIPEVGHQQTVRAIAYADLQCPDKPYTFSEPFDPNSEYYQITGIYIRDSSQLKGLTCNNDEVLLDIHAHNLGINPFFEVFRNDILIDTFTYYGENPDFSHQVKSTNYWDRFSVRFTNTSCNCLIVNSRTSNYVYPNLHTTSALKMPVIATDVGGDTICTGDQEQTYSVSLKGMEQFDQNTTVIWMVDDKEWARYEYLPTVSSALAPQPDKHPQAFIVDLNEQQAFDNDYAFYLNDPEGKYPKLYETFIPGSRIWAIVISGAECEGTSQYTFDTVDAIIPKFVPQKPASANLLASSANLEICQNETISFELENLVGAGTNPSVKWFWNGVDVKTNEPTYTLHNPKDGDSLYAEIYSDYKCASNLPLRMPTQVIQVHPLPEIALSDTVICNGDELLLNPHAPTATQWSWKTSATLSSTTAENPTISGLSADQTTPVYLTITDPNGCQNTDTLLIESAGKNPVNAKITFAENTDSILCKGEYVALLADFFPLTKPEVPVQRKWLKNGFDIKDDNATIIRPQAQNLRDKDQFQLKITVSENYKTCYPRTVLSPVITIHVNSLTKTEITPESLTLCDQENIRINVRGTQQNNYTWISSDKNIDQSHSTEIFVKPAETTKYYLYTYDTDSACTAMDSLEITVNQYLPVSNTITLAENQKPTFCQNADSTFRFTAQTVNPGENPTYEWYVNGIRQTETSKNFSAALTDQDQVYSIVRTPNLPSCGNLFALSDTITIERLPLPQASASGDTNVCVDEQAPLTATGGEKYLWTPAEGLNQNNIANPIATLKQTQNYQVQVWGANGCVVTLDPVKVDVTPTPEKIVAEIAPVEDSVCAGSEITLNLEANYPEKREIQWFVGGTLQTSTTDQLKGTFEKNTPIYAVVKVNSEKCLAQTETPSNTYLAQLLTPPTVSLPKQFDTLCQGDTLRITALSQATRFQWRPAWEMSLDNSQAAIELFPPKTTTYSVVAIIGNCESQTAANIEVFVKERPQTPTVSGPQINPILFCKTPLALKIDNTQPNVVYTWFAAENLQTPLAAGTSFEAPSAGTYTVKAKNQAGCESKTYAIVQIPQGIVPEAKLEIRTREILVKEPVEFENQSANTQLLQINFGDQSPKEEIYNTRFEHTYDTIGTFVLEIIAQSSDQCFDTLRMPINILPQMSGVFVPSAFMPAAENDEDKVLKVYGVDIQQIVFCIYTVKGEQVFETRSLQNGWNGTFNGQEMPTGNYTYTVVARLSNGEEIKKTGVAALIR